MGCCLHGDAIVTKMYRLVACFLSYLLPPFPRFPCCLSLQLALKSWWIKNQQAKDMKHAPQRVQTQHFPSNFHSVNSFEIFERNWQSENLICNIFICKVKLYPLCKGNLLKYCRLRMFSYCQPSEPNVLSSLSSSRMLTCVFSAPPFLLEFFQLQLRYSLSHLPHFLTSSLSLSLSGTINYYHRIRLAGWLAGAGPTLAGTVSLIAWPCN